MGSHARSACNLINMMGEGGRSKLDGTPLWSHQPVLHDSWPRSPLRLNKGSSFQLGSFISRRSLQPIATICTHPTGPWAVSTGYCDFCQTQFTTSPVSNWTVLLCFTVVSGLFRVGSESKIVKDSWRQDVMNNSVSQDKMWWATVWAETTYDEQQCEPRQHNLWWATV